MPTPDPLSITLMGVFIAGLATSLHCAGMCGLLTCGLGIAGHSSQTASIGIYHATRLIGYAVAGGIAGFVGQVLGISKILPGFQWLPLLLVLLLGVIAFGVDNRIAAVPGLGKAVHLIRSKTLSVPPLARAGIVGLSTPLLPCGPLYAVLAIALASGSAVRGSEIMICFGLGALPAIWGTQIASVWMNRKLHARHFQAGRRILAGLAAVSLLWHFAPWPLSAESADDDGTCRCNFEIAE